MARLPWTVPNAIPVPFSICDNSNSIGGSSYAASIGAAPNGDVYVAAYDNNTAALWKNGTEQLLGTGGNSSASGVFVYTH